MCLLRKRHKASIISQFNFYLTLNTQKHITYQSSNWVLRLGPLLGKTMKKYFFYFKLGEGFLKLKILFIFLWCTTATTSWGAMNNSNLSQHLPASHNNILQHNLQRLLHQTSIWTPPKSTTTCQPHTASPLKVL